MCMMRTTEVLFEDGCCLTAPRLARLSTHTPVSAGGTANNVVDEEAMPDSPTYKHLPSLSIPLMTGAYQLTLENRMHAEDLERNGQFDTTLWIPVFVIGSLQLPGTLAYVLDHRSGLACARAMLPGRLVKSNQCGTIVLGRGRENRRAIGSWYGTTYVCTYVQVDIELADESTRTIQALMWVPRDDWDGHNKVTIPEPHQFSEAFGEERWRRELNPDKVEW